MPTKQLTSPVPTSNEPLTMQAFMQFVASIPKTTEPLEWMIEFRTALMNLLGDVDRIIFSLNNYCDVRNLHQVHQRVGIMQIVVPGEQRPIRTVTRSAQGKGSTSEFLIKESERVGLLVDKQPPLCFEYYLSETIYIATIILLRRQTAPPISQRTLETLNALESFLLSVFSNFIIRHRLSRPKELLGIHIVDNISMDYPLTDLEMRVLLLQMFGFTYRQIGERLYVTASAVQKHIKSIHRKTNCSTYFELFARYLARDLENAPTRIPETEDGTVTMF